MRDPSRPRRGSALCYVAAQGAHIVVLGRRVFGEDEAQEIATDLRARGYADAHAESWYLTDSHPGRHPGPFALTLVYRKDLYPNGSQ